MTAQENNIEGTTALVAAKSLVVESSNSYQAAMNFGNEINKRIVQIKEVSAIDKDAAHKVWKNYCEKERQEIAPFLAAKDLIDSACAAYRRAEKERAEKEAAEARANVMKAAEEDRLRTAEQLEKTNRPEQAMKILDAPIVPKMYAIPMAAIPITEGASFRENWKARIVDESMIPREFLMPDEKKINQIVKAMKNLTNIQGVEVYCEEITARRRGNE